MYNDANGVFHMKRLWVEAGIILDGGKDPQDFRHNTCKTLLHWGNDLESCVLRIGRDGFERVIDSCRGHETRGSKLPVNNSSLVHT